MTVKAVGLSPTLAEADPEIAQAIRNGISRVSRTVRNVEWFEATEIRGRVEEFQLARELAAERLVPHLMRFAVRA